MQVDVDGTRLWYDVEGSGRDRPTLVLVHGGPGCYDHQYLKPDFGRMAAEAQVVYLDLRGHGRSDWGEAADSTLEACADDIRARHPGHAAGLIAHGSFARPDIPRLVEGFRRGAGDDRPEPFFGLISEFVQSTVGRERVA